MCHGIKTDDGGEIVDFDADPWNSLNRSTYRPSLVEWRSEVRRRSKINIAAKRGSKLLKKDNLSPSQWTIPRCQLWLDLHPIWDESDVAFLRSEIQLRLDVATKAVEQKKSEEQKLCASDVGNNWYG
jgi:hypothetical protein